MAWPLPKLHPYIIQGTMDDDEWEIKYDDNDDH